MKPSQPTPLAAESVLTPILPIDRQLAHDLVRPFIDMQGLGALEAAEVACQRIANWRALLPESAGQQRIAELEAELAVIRKAVEAVLPDVESGYIGNTSLKAQRRADRHCKALRAALTPKPRA